MLNYISAPRQSDGTALCCLETGRHIALFLHQALAKYCCRREGGKKMTDYLMAEAGIRQLHARYADAVFRKDFDAFADCFTEDAEWRLGQYVLRGRQEAVAFLQERIANSHFVLMTFRSPLLQIGPGTATGRTYVTELNAYRNAPPNHTVATYYERFVAYNGVWRRAFALFQLHYMGPEDMSGTFFTTPDYGPPPAMPPEST